jgi:hypothetical protein
LKFMYETIYSKKFQFYERFFIARSNHSLVKWIVAQFAKVMFT